ncbi:peroxidase-related enzyme [Haloarchaeobius sp. TZWWS8]|uniref:peroxidase-related enzyme n=1 Tax=Haloarchaeobius sp. TZWWS8 TaxID=3446121 RepID=UPI003EB9FDBE
MSDDEPIDDSAHDEVPAMTRFEVPDRSELPEDLRERIDEEEERAGFVPNVFLAYGYRPSHFRAFFQYYDALVEHTELEREEIEMIIVAVSGVNDCYYCNVAHGALVRIYADDPLLADQLVSNHRTADLNDAHLAMLDFAVKLTEEPAKVDESDFETLRGHGFSERAIWDVGSVTSFFNLSNRMAHLADMRPNAEFHTLGR